jgi:predicted nucleotide-binding protein
MNENDISAKIKSDLPAWNQWIKATEDRLSFSKINLRGMNLEGINFGYADWAEVVMDGASLRRCCSKAPHFSDLSATEADFSEVRLGGSWGRRVDPGHILYLGTSFRGAKLARSKFNQSDLREVDFGDSDLTEVSFFGSDLRHATFEGAVLDGANFEKASLLFAKFDDSAPPELRRQAKEWVQLDTRSVPISGVSRLRKGMSRLKKLRDVLDEFAISDYRKSNDELGTDAAKIDDEISALLRLFYGDDAEVDAWIEDYGIDLGPQIYGVDLWHFGKRQKITGTTDRAKRALDNLSHSVEEALSYAIEQRYRERMFGEAVFIVHGHDEASREAVARFLEKIGFQVIILHERPNKGRTIITKFREEAEEVGFAVVLMTPDDTGGKVGGPLAARARQNVVFELGFFIGALGPERVAALVKGPVERPSDFDGVVYISLDDPGWKASLARELEAADFEMDWNVVMRS